jgi:hypothetical protein
VSVSNAQISTVMDTINFAGLSNHECLAEVELWDISADGVAENEVNSSLFVWTPPVIEANASKVDPFAANVTSDGSLGIKGLA